MLVIIRAVAEDALHAKEINMSVAHENARRIISDILGKQNIETRLVCRLRRFINRLLAREILSGL
ncbi:Sugar isomerase [Salmonella enterica subsp. enterica]|uniref:Sugar isomerase n=1 Tax=Salmonella enterica I TaxID=59201 RepID=A0A3S4FAX5_SALET|nr:Sugar isomerase [Salmonella enterica subsp. enterica]